MKNQTINCNEAKKIDLVDYLFQIGMLPSKELHGDYWYLSPFRDEKTPSFKVNPKKNIWYDFGTGEGGTIIDFGIKYHNCTISGFLEILNHSFSFHQPYNFHKPNAAGQKKKIKVIAATSISNPALCRYLHDRSIPVELANVYCREVHYALHNRHYYAIGFQNNSGGYELRNKYFKGSSSPKDVTLVAGKNRQKVAVFEGFFSFLSYLQIKHNFKHNLPFLQPDFLILNSLSLFKRSMELLKSYDKVHLFLDQDEAGSEATLSALGWGKQFADCRSCYDGFKDFNQLLTKKTITKISQLNTVKSELSKSMASGVFVRQKPQKRKVSAPGGRKMKM